MTNRAQIEQPLQVDIFTLIPAGSLVTYTDQGAPTGHYKIIPDAPEFPPFMLPSADLSKHCKYYVQALLF